jgi:opacity protein-like surface antigen
MKRMLAALLPLIVATLAHAQTPYPPSEPPSNSGPYAGALFGRAEAKTGCIGVLSGGDRACDTTDLAFGAFGGWQMHRHFGAEIGYTYLGKLSANAISSSSATSQYTETSVWDAAAVGFLPLDDVLPIGRGLSAYARLGGYLANLTSSQRGVGDQSNVSLTYGAGLQYDIGSKIGLRALWQRYKNVGGGDYLKQNYDVLGLSALYRFR